VRAAPTGQPDCTTTLRFSVSSAPPAEGQ
jgi:hypothetical protein